MENFATHQEQTIKNLENEISSLTEDNWHELYVLGEFMGNKFLQTDNYYTRVIQSIEVSYEGIMCVAGGEDETPTFREVFEEELAKIISNNKEKVKSKRY